MKNKQINYNVILISMLVLFPAVSNYICRVVNMVMARLIGVGFSQELFDGIVWAFVLALCIPWFATKLKAKHVFVLLCMWGAALLMAVFGLSSELTTERLVTLCLTVFPMFLVGSVLDVKKEDFKIIYWLSVIVLIVSVAYQAYKIASGDIISEDNMDFSYKLLPAALIVIAGCFYNKYKVLSIIPAVVAIFAIIMQGTRGPVLCVAVFLVIMLIKRFGFLKLIPVILVLTIGVVAFSSSDIYESTMKSIAEFIEDIGMSPRFIEKLLEEELADDNGRQWLYDAVLKEIEQNPFKFRGLYADRALLNPITGADNAYVHNIIYELLLNFGVLLGGAVFLLIVALILLALMKLEFEKLYLVDLLVMIGFVMLFVSGSVVDNQLLYVLLGLACQIVFKGKERKKKDEAAVDM